MTLFAVKNVVDLPTQKISTLPAGAQKTLKLAAAIGNRFQPKLLSSLYDESLKVTLQAIAPAVKAGLIIPTNSDYFHLIENESSFSFQHDKVQQACYELIAHKQKDQITNRTSLVRTIE